MNIFKTIIDWATDYNVNDLKSDVKVYPDYHGLINIWLDCNNPGLSNKIAAYRIFDAMLEICDVYSLDKPLDTDLIEDSYRNIYNGLISLEEK